jgi:DNA (cytosine-5)-methyltransferase 1
MPICPTCKQEFVHLSTHLNKKKKCSPPLEVNRLTSEIEKLSSTVETLTKRVNELQTLPQNTVTYTTNAISLFSGAGGDTCGIERAGYKVVAFNEFNNAATRTHTTMFPDSLTLVNAETAQSDIKKVPDSIFQTYKGQVNLIFAGFPCQGFSHAGKKKSDDARNELVHEFARATKIIQPKWIIGENVKGLLARKGKDPYQPATAPLRPVIDIIKDLFERIGYKITYKVIDVTEIGVPQHRKRLIIVGHRGDQYPHMPWESLEPASTPFQTSIRAFLEPHLQGAMILPALYKPQDQPAHYWIQTTETAVQGTPHKNLERLVLGIRNTSTKEREENPSVDKQIIEPDGLISYGVRKGGYHGMIVNPDTACNTIISTYNLCPRLFVGLHNTATNTYYIRCMTPKELGQIQGFPANYNWQGTEKEQIAQIGNAVPPPLAERIVKTFPRVEFKSTPQSVTSTDEEDEEEDELTHV